VKYQNFDQSVRPLLEVISIGAAVGGNGSAELRFQRVWGHTGLAPLSVMNVDAFDFGDLDQSVESLRMVPQSLRAELANAFAKALMERNVMGGQEATFVRYLCQRWEVATQWKVAPGFKA
jgi:hypothetical protein